MLNDIMVRCRLIKRFCFDGDVIGQGTEKHELVQVVLLKYESNKIKDLWLINN